MRPLGVVVEHPLVHQLAHVGQRAKQVGVEQLAAKLAVKAFYVSVLGRIVGLNPVQGDALRLTPLGQPGTDEPGAIVRAQLRGPAVVLDQARQHPHHPGGGQREIDFDAEQLPVVVIEHVQRPKPTAIRQDVAREVERPAHVGGCGHG